jgi:hypothetical protein
MLPPAADVATRQRPSGRRNLRLAFTGGPTLGSYSASTVQMRDPRDHFVSETD